MNLIDEAALSLARSQGGDARGLGPADIAALRQSVIAVLAALRDPDEAMTEAGMEVVRTVGPFESEQAYRNDAANIWRFMIDALLDQKSSSGSSGVS